MPTVDFEKIKQEQFKENVKKLKTTDIEDKIKNFAEKTGYTTDEIRKEIRSNEMIRWFFAKDPLKQNIHELTAVNAIKNVKGVHEFKKLHTNELFTLNGAIFSGAEVKAKKMTTTAKSIDFYWKYGNKEFYASHKYTKDEGGAQGNQYKDLQRFIESCNNSAGDDKVFLAIADGNFYQAKNGQAHTTRIQHLKDLSDRRHVFALTMNELEDVMDKVQ